MVYVVNSASNTVAVIDGNTNSVAETTRAGKTPHGVSVNVYTNAVYVANRDSNTYGVIFIDASSMKTNDIPVDTSPIAVAFNPCDSRHLPKRCS
ncbi:MAG: hypothetical protein WA667_10085 [Candidatus Nitrosopolaris sp.]